MKKLITILILLGVLAALLLAYTLLSKKNNTDDTDIGDTAAESDVIFLQQSDSKNITGIEYSYQNNTVRLQRTDDNLWQAADDPAYPLGQDKPKAMADAVATVAAYRLIDSTGSRFAEYGLESPKNQIRVSYADGSEITYRIGSYVSYTKTYYLNIEGQNEVYTVSGALLDYFAFSLSDLAQPDTVPSIKEDYVTAISVSRPGELPLEITAERPEDDADAVVWKAGEETVSGTYVSDLISAVNGLPLNDLVFWGEQTEDKLASLGLDAEHVTTVTVSYYEIVTISGEDDSISSGSKKVSHTFTVRIGGTVTAADTADPEETADICYYVSVEDSDLIYSVSEAKLAPFFAEA